MILTLEHVIPGLIKLKLEKQTTSQNAAMFKTPIRRKGLFIQQIFVESLTLCQVPLLDEKDNNGEQEALISVCCFPVWKAEDKSEKKKYK